jgi:hypothetical protein
MLDHQHAKGIDVLALSGGGANGAFGAGLLTRWGASGSRPQSQVVTGISTGALIAPFAFLGADGDAELSHIFFGPQISHLLKKRGLAVLFTPDVYSRAPLEHLVRGYVTDDLLRRIALEHAKGRRLLVASTNLDTEQLVIWDMGAIATQGGPAARDLFSTVLLASASVPGVFPPTFIDVEAGGRVFQEMHVDGQIESAFFAIPQTLLLASQRPGAQFDVELCVIVNGQFEPHFQLTPRGTIPILVHSLDAGTKASIRSVLLTTAEFCMHNGCSLHLATLPNTTIDSPLDFSDAHTLALFAAGQAFIDQGAVWRTPADAPSAKGYP